jgi:hypothetical protein
MHINPKDSQPKLPSSRYESEVEQIKQSNSHKEPIIEDKSPSTPILNPGEKEAAINAAHSLDSRKVTDTIGVIDVKCICKCLAHAIMKHIEFSKGNILIDDLVPNEEDVPEFSYGLGKELKIDFEEIHRKKEEEAYIKYQQKMENYLKLQEMMRAGDPNDNYYNHYQGDLYEDEEQYFDEASYFSEQQQQMVSQSVMFNPNYDHHQNMMGGGLNQDIARSNDPNSGMCPQMQPGDPNNNFYNYALVQVDDFLKDEGIEGADPTDLVNAYYNNLALMQQQKPFLFPPPDLGEIQSFGSMENSSKYLGSISAHSNKIIKAKDSESLKVEVSSSKLHSHTGNDDSDDEEIPCEIEEFSDEDVEVNAFNDPNIPNELKIGSKNAIKRKNSPVVLSSYSDTLKTSNQPQDSPHKQS